MKQKIRDYLMDILNECNYLLTEENMDFNLFLHNEHVKRAFVRSLEVIGEAAKNIPSFIRENYPQIKWREVAGMRDKLIHEYFGINYEVVWKTIKKDIPPLKETIEKILNDIKEEADG